MKIVALRIVHGLFALYFLMCLIYLYYAAITGHFMNLLIIAVLSLGLEGFIVFVINKGDCPLIHVQTKIGDDKPFFELFFSPPRAAHALPIFALITWIGVGLLAIRLVLRSL